MGSDRNDYKCGFSNYNGTSSSQKYYDLCAPGEQILSTIPGGAYASYSGTSPATALTAGVLALLRAYRLDLTNDQIDTVLYHACDTMPDPLYKNGQLGWGRVNQWRALNDLSGVEVFPPHASRLTPYAAFPNPFTSFASVPGHASEHFTLYDISGRKVGIYKGDRIGEGLSPGVYFLCPDTRNPQPEARILRIVKVR
jgi:hypothetical protein